MDLVKTEDISSEMGSLGENIEGEELYKMQELCMLYHMTAQDITDAWFAYKLNKNCDKLTLELLNSFEIESLTKLAKKAAVMHHTPSRKNQRKRDAHDQVVEDYRSPHNLTPKLRDLNQSRSLAFSPGSLSSPSGTPSSDKYKQRKNAGDVVCSWGSAPEEWITAGSTQVGDIENLIRPLEDDGLYLMDMFKDQKIVLSDLIEDRSVHLAKKNEVEMWGSINNASPDEIAFVGHVLTGFDGKLSGSKVFLEDHHGGGPVQLDLSRLDSFALFPGQIIAGRGTNLQGKAITVTEIFKNELLPFSRGPFNDESLHIVAACGPYTTLETLSYEPIQDLLTYCKKHRPHVCVLMGPFVDSQHPHLEQLDESYDQIFNDLMETITSTLSETNTKLVLVPSLREAGHDPAFPVPPLPLISSSYSKNISNLSDPCYVNVNGVIIGATSTDILLHLGKEELDVSSNSTDRLGRLCQHLLQQWSLYPLYPSNEDVPLDLERNDNHKLFDQTPHIVFVPSDLRSFLKDVDGCFCVNPAKLMKGQAGGTFAQIIVDPVPHSHSGSILPYIHAQIVKI